MTITLKPWMTALLIATICVLAGFAAGQIANARSEKTASASNAQTTQLRQINRTLKNAVGSQYTSNSILGRLYNIQKNTGNVCREVSGSALCTIAP